LEIQAFKDIFHIARQGENWVSILCHITLAIFVICLYPLSHQEISEHSGKVCASYLGLDYGELKNQRIKTPILLHMENKAFWKDLSEKTYPYIIYVI
jgi:hypothetical protein